MSFGKDVGRFKELTDKAAGEIVRSITLNLFGSVIRDTPIDTGRARGEWQTSVGKPAEGLNERINRGGVAGSYAEAVAKVPQEAGVEVFMTNNLPYINDLEYGGYSGPTEKVTAQGFSRKAPAGMVRRNVARAQRIVRAAIAKFRV